ncbi:MAG: DNA-processing protein DprA [Oscillospiraceae bacterium]|nr:DNA-processing protein DprA [Oscillospiraceae bacterium]
MSKSPVEVWLWLLLVMEPYNPKTHFILEECGGDASEAARRIRDGKYDFLSDAQKKNAESVRMKDVREVMELCEKNRVRIITLNDEEYPPLLRGIENPPIVLFCAGSLKGLNNSITLSVVGARSISDYGLMVTSRVLEPLVKLGVVIISGIAVGADAAAHSVCLRNHGRTVAVLGCGILVNYPAENAALKREIIANGGAIVSELMPMAKPSAHYFHTRNRIIAGLSLGTLVTEAGSRSGSLLTANHALAQERDVFCVPPHDLFSSKCNGVVPLLREGAKAVYNFTDILDSFSMYFSNTQYVRDFVADIERREFKRKTPRKPIAKMPENIAQDPDAEITENVKKSEKTPHTELAEELLSSLEPIEAELLKALAESPAKVDKLVETLGKSVDELTEALTNLEIAGYIARGADGDYVLE